MNRKDELSIDRDRDRIPDDADTAEAIKDVFDTFKTDDVGKDLGVGGIGATNDDEPGYAPGKKTRSTNQ